MAALYKVPLVLAPQPEGGFTITSPVLPELITEGDTVEETLANVQDALEAAIELHEDLGRQMPNNLQQNPLDKPVSFEGIVAVA